ncbi:hypothetical protein J0383_18785 [Flavobacterium endoglycinae]|uniref:Uncharacterized protein n=1 Tax=Flavobacterium endoglycinae TaxID=2816357 RepID=A0ABX7QB84_9FLAO|nr:hypothetical protein [Flavobacterium endoglycinae]QSW88296.1 hypothetical protein J0383_18785 [Flavobacterium endoglycinae]
MELFELLKKYTNTVIEIQAKYMLIDKSHFTDRFFAYLREVNNSDIVVEQFFIKTDDEGNNTLVSNKRGFRKR